MKKVAVVTGGSRGIGRAIALALAESGADIILNYRSNEEQAKQVAKLIEQKGSRAIIVQADVSKMSEVKNLSDQAFKHFGKVDILVNNAGIVANIPFNKLEENQFWNITTNNLGGVFNCCKIFIDGMSTQGWGRIVNISSQATKLPVLGSSGYTPSKSAIEGLSKVLAAEYSKHGVTVNVVSPAIISTDIHKSIPKEIILNLITKTMIGRLGLPEEVAAIVNFLCSEEASFITGQHYAVDGGYCCC